MIFNKLQGKLKDRVREGPGFGDNKTAMIRTLAIFAGARLVGEEGSGLELDAENFDPAILGTVKKATITKDDTVLLNGGGESSMVKERVELLRGLIDGETSDYNREKLQERLAKLSGGRGGDQGGGGSEVEVNGEKDRHHGRPVLDPRRPCRRALFPVVVWRCCARARRWTVCLATRHSQRTSAPVCRSSATPVRLPAHTIVLNAGKEGAVVVEKVLENNDVTVGYDAQRRLVT
ncbi:chaperonin HSP60, mitochondrial precursor [Trypanosoma cruzi]|nr:chaperonin HSP60, mitochondrial precursor [Trypanosoma cruzi]